MAPPKKNREAELSTFVLMRLLESAPRRYDLGIRLLSLGRIQRVHARMAQQVEAGERVLEIGCGTGSLALRCAEKGASVIAIDISPQMLDVARGKVDAAGLERQIELRRMSAVDLDEAFPEATFDLVVSSLMFSELSEDEQAFVLIECRRLLRAGGRLLIADEAEPRPWPLRLLARFLRLPLVVLTYVLTQTATRAVVGLQEKIAAAGFRVRGVERSLLGGLELVVADSPETGE
jgi:demethylmenaquinone methyltransferase/2-methoxy-6-polyprenyl-1,4-benzoquinol methylase